MRPVDTSEVRLEPDGRLFIPPPIRLELGFREGEMLEMRVDRGRLVIEKRDAILTRIQDRFRKISPEIDLADELIRERRREALVENREEFR